MNKKAIYLLLALCLPVLIFVFLRIYGKNQFDIPVYFQNGVENNTGCSGDYTKPYSLADSMAAYWPERNHEPLLVIFDTTGQTDSNLKRLWNDFTSKDVVVVRLTQNEKISLQQLAQWKRCVFMLEEPWTAVLIDEENRIRGYYQPTSLEEMDRLLVELKILLKKY